MLTGLIRRGLNSDVAYLFVIDGSKALRSALDEVFGERARVQRCRTHKQRFVLDRIPDQTIKAQTQAVMHAAYQLPEKEGIARLKQQAQWLNAHAPDAAASLLEGLDETFTEKSFRKIQGVKDLWVLAAALGRNDKCIDTEKQVA